MKNEVATEGDEFRIILHHEKKGKDFRTIDVVYKR